MLGLKLNHVSKRGPRDQLKTSALYPGELFWRKYTPWKCYLMMASSNGNIFHIAGPFLRGIHRSPGNSQRKGQWRGALVFSLICAWINSRVKESWGWWFETPSCSLLRHCNVPPTSNVVSCVASGCTVARTLFRYKDRRPMYEDPRYKGGFEAVLSLL